MNKTVVSLATLSRKPSPATKTLKTNLESHTSLPHSHYRPKDILENAVEKVALDYQAHRAATLSTADSINRNQVSWSEVIQDIPMELWNKHGFYEADGSENAETVTLRHRENAIIAASLSVRTNYMLRRIRERMYKMRKENQINETGADFPDSISSFEMEMLKKYRDCTRNEFYLYMLLDTIKTPKSINNIFGIERTSTAPDERTVLFEAETMDGTVEQICRNENGKYSLTVKAAEGEDYARLGMGEHYVDEEITLPISREYAMDWAEKNLWGDTLVAARGELGERSAFIRMSLTELRGGSGTDSQIFREWLGKIDAEEFVFYSTDNSYPLCSGSTTLSQPAENEAGWVDYDVYEYYIPAETARRLAEAHGMDKDTYEEFFGTPTA